MDNYKHNRVLHGVLHHENSKMGFLCQNGIFLAFLLAFRDHDTLNSNPALRLELTGAF